MPIPAHVLTRILDLRKVSLIPSYLTKKNSSQCLTPICSFFLCFSCFHAPFWWQEAKKRHNGDNDGSNPTIPWAWFEREFNDQYLDVMSREALRQQFVSLKQGSGTVQDYNMKCDNLMRYAPDIVADDFRLRRQYLEGLNPRFTQIIDLPGSSFCSGAAPKTSVKQKKVPRYSDFGFIAWGNPPSHECLL